MRTKKLIGVLGLALAAVSCQKLGTGPAQPGGLAFQPVQFKDAIPAEFGELEGVTSNNARPDIAQLWFRKDDGTVVMVAVNFVEGRLVTNALAIPRK
jgi:hypothetical protein